ncbi:MAG: amylo-alpha-1,6-glucosidase [Herpetosiphonaceae bacterium]|nr:amylo-alpha-1,6-glucosidase [Herpetosiphonaceae bacterium]
MTHQTLDFGPIHLQREDREPAPYMLSGHKAYVLATTNGALDPLGAEHLVGEMGGLWVHPVKFADGWYTVIHQDETATAMTSCEHFEGRMSDATLHFRHNQLTVARTDVMAEDAAALFGLLQVSNIGTEVWQGAISMVLRVNIRPSWFSGWERGQTLLREEQGLVTAYDSDWQGRWGLAYGSPESPNDVLIAQDGAKDTVELRYEVTIEPGATRRWEFLLTADHQHGHDAARQLWASLAGQGAQILAAKRERYAEIAWGGVQLETPDPDINHEYALAKLNLHMLWADYAPYLPGYFLAGVPEYPQLFGCDTTYSVPGATAAGFTQQTKSALQLLADRARMACGRVPHEITTNGRTFNPGNTQETPQFALAAWDYVRWSGDLAFLREMYPLCREGVMEYVGGLWDFDGDGYPWGDAMVERTGMGALKLDSACYLYAAWRVLGEMAAILERPEAEQYRSRANDWRGRFERDWWLPDQHLYADSLHSDLQPQLDGHWTQVVPVQLGIARPERAEQVLDELHRSFTNEYGLMHTRGEEARVWTLGTGLLALADVRYGRTSAAVEQLHHIALTTHNGMLGAFEELIPAGLCFMQLWSAAMYVQCVVEGFLGLDPLAHAHQLTIRQSLPPDWPSLALRNVQIGKHRLDIRATTAGCEIHHRAGQHPLHLRYGIRSTNLASYQPVGAATTPVSLETVHDGTLLCFDLRSASSVSISITGDQATLSIDTLEGGGHEQQGPN